MAKNNYLPRVMRLRDAPAYLGMNKNLFNRLVRPQLIQIPIGNHGIGFDRLDLDAWLEDYKDRSGRPATSKSEVKALWDADACQDSPCGAGYGTLTKKLTDNEFTKALDRVILQKQKNT